jgi:hypothetical protein
MTVIAEVNPNEYKVLENVPTQPGARTIAINKKTHHLYLTTAEFEPPAAGSTNRRAAVKPGTFVLLDVAPVK